MNWQLIETAPRDGTEIIAGWQGTACWATVIVRFRNGAFRKGKQKAYQVTHWCRIVPPKPSP